jgi:hypothetical protein
MSAKPSLSVSFHNFWRRFDVRSSFFFKALSETYDVTIERAGRDLQISSVFDTERLPAVSGSRPLRVWWTGEAGDPRSQVFDLHFGFRPTSILGSRWFRYPLWITYIDWWDPQSAYHVDRLLAPRGPTQRPRFCNFIYGSEPSIRTEFFLRLNEARRVDSLGRVLNNAGARARGRDGKMQALSESLFTIAFENQVAPGYVTEKLVEPLLAGSIPIYWGAPEAKQDFNPDAFVFAEDFAGFDDLIRHILRLADSPDAIATLASAPPFSENRIAYEHTPAFFVDRIGEALSGPATALASERWRAAWPPTRRHPIKALERRIRRLTRSNSAVPR